MKMVLKTKIAKYIAGIALALSVTACASTQAPTKNAINASPAQTIEAQQPVYKVEQLSVTIPEELTVSEANTFVPRADIVWREDPRGNRKHQVQAIMANAIAEGVSQVAEGQPVTMEVRVNLFHAVTEKARYTVGGKHNINFDYLLRDVNTGLPVAEIKNIDASFKAHGGRKAVAAEQRGETQKVRITQRVRDIMYKEMIGNTES
ncbi:hypothetical protein F9L33_13370 [Amylibacter sp. SFDW26]|uniref:DUF6778 family protein n=1 Tax=Amylibacter sp. SFDW26 TaxID=2652722 RepID=UPI001261B2F1|nr:DUF6778 family protein [Amylibacter sp. SFDW26]KAB7610295.1 hypothetical protein F9L33_13370 [Amylibacter sp. SFDW26]